MSETASDVEAPAAARCLNCGAALAGPYCASCGQRDDRHVHSLGHFLAEAFEGLTHADSRVWKTLWPLLVRPGFLTREFFAGRRQRYLPPFRLYIVVSLLFFLVLALIPDLRVVQVDLSPTAPEKSVDARLNEVISQAEAPGLSRERRAALAVAQRALEAQRERAAAQGKSEVDAGEPVLPGAQCDDLSYEGPGAGWLQPRLIAGCQKTLADKQLLGRAFLHNVPRAMFFLLPLIAAFMLLLYWRPRRYYVEHLLFFIHNHAMVFLLGTLLVPVFWLMPEGLATYLLIAALLLWLFWYLFRAMRVYYGQGRRRTLAKYLFMGSVYLIASTVLAVITIFYSVATL
ncbi:MAG: DUF3667 domain-containing protein [Steroidobacteraceae bacterium]|nr:DUF3667 domain-containing protein [Steroidobacteraceae bacterium]